MYYICNFLTVCMCVIILTFVYLFIPHLFMHSSIPLAISLSISTSIYPIYCFQVEKYICISSFTDSMYSCSFDKLFINLLFIYLSYVLFTSRKVFIYLFLRPFIYVLVRTFSKLYVYLYVYLSYILPTSRKVSLFIRPFIYVLIYSLSKLSVCLYIYLCYISITSRKVFWLHRTTCLSSLFIFTSFLAAKNKGPDDYNGSNFENNYSI